MYHLEYSANAVPDNLKEALVSLPEIELTALGQLDPVVRRTWISILKSVLTQEQMQRLSAARTELYSTDMNGGYALVQGVNPSSISDENQKRWAFAICCFFGSPIHVFLRRGVWHDVPVNLNAHPTRYSGTGYNPFHIDVMNAEKPPELVAFHCIRNDPNGGGRNLISNIREAFRELTDVQQKGLETERFDEGVFFHIENAGGERDPYPVVEFGNNGDPLFRFTARGVDKQNSEYKRELLSSLNAALSKRAIAADLRPGDLLILNQRVMTHAREPLGLEQEGIKPELRRLLHRLFMNFEEYED